MLLSAVLVLAASTAQQTAAQSTPPRNGSFTTALGGQRIHYEVHGRGPLLMALPNAWGLTLDALRGMYRPLEERLTLVYFDPRGMGGSGPARADEDRGMAAVRADFDALRRHLGIGKANAIGWSNGAVNLLLLSEERPETFSSLILVHGVASYGPEDGKAFAERHPEMTARFSAFQKELADPALTDAERTARQRRMWMAEYFPFLLADPASSKAKLQEIFKSQPFSHPHTRQTDRESQGFDARPGLHRITARTLVIAGAKDAAPSGKVKEIADGIPGAVFQVFAASGHFAPIEEAEAFRKALFAFLDVGPSGPR
jgi:pimeloyl-ACP methyl ester carboxylesterase